MTEPLLAAFDWQAAWCDAGAPFTARVLRRSRQWLAADAAARAVFAALTPDPQAGAVPLRWAGGLHLLALQGRAPWAALWPPAGSGLAATDAATDAALDAAIAGAWRTQRSLLQDALSRPPQTNEVQRSAALLPGLLWLAAATGLPLVLLEIGASAGLNLWCDRYRLAPRSGPAWAWGDPASPVLLRPDWQGPPPWPGVQPPALRIAGRAGCDAHPVDLRRPGEGLRLASFVWPEQGERMARLQAAQGAAARWMAADRVAVEALPALDFLRRELAAVRPGLVTVLMHSVVWQYIGATEQAAITQVVAEAAGRAAAGAPLAWLRFEPDGPQGGIELRCRLWPEGSEHLLAECHAHGQHVHWLTSA